MKKRAMERKGKIKEKKKGNKKKNNRTDQNVDLCSSLFLSFSVEILFLFFWCQAGWTQKRFLPKLSLTFTTLHLLKKVKSQYFFSFFRLLFPSIIFYSFIPTLNSTLNYTLFELKLKWAQSFKCSTISSFLFVFSVFCLLFLSFFLFSFFLFLFFLFCAQVNTSESYLISMLHLIPFIQMQHNFQQCIL